VAQELLQLIIVIVIVAIDSRTFDIRLVYVPKARCCDSQLGYFIASSGYCNEQNQQTTLNLFIFSFSTISFGENQQFIKNLYFETR